MAAGTEVTRSLDCNIERSPGRDRILVAVSARSFCRAIHRMALPSIGFKQGNDEVLCKGDLTSGSLEFNNHSLGHAPLKRISNSRSQCYPGNPLPRPSVGPAPSQ